jgi:hypothetical protein
MRKVRRFIEDNAGGDMKTYQLGPDVMAFPMLETAGADWVGYWYEKHHYSGGGIAVWKIGNKYDYADLDHCSCYGPDDNITDAATMTPIELLAEMRPSKEDFDYAYAIKVYRWTLRKTREARKTMLEALS